MGTRSLSLDLASLGTRMRAPTRVSHSTHQATREEKKRFDFNFCLLGQRRAWRSSVPYYLLSPQGVPCTAIEQQ